MNIINTMFIFTIVIGAISIVAIIFTLIKQTYVTRYNELEKRVEINEIRTHLEKEIFELNSKLMAGEERWKEVNHLILSAQNTMTNHFEKENSKNYNFLSNFSIQRDNIEIDERYIFTLIPFNEYSNNTYESIKGACNAAGFHCSRGDEKNIEGDILPQIIKEIIKAKIIIAVIDGRNPNVFYELGVAHALNKKVILVSRNIEKIPFDLQSKNILLYDNYEDLYNRCKEILFKIQISEK